MIQIILKKIIIVINPINWIKLFIVIIRSIPSILKTIYQFVSFFILLIIFLSDQIFRLFEKIWIIGKLFRKIRSIWKKIGSPPINLLVQKLEKTSKSEVQRSYLIKLAYKNLMARKTRAIITILGMLVGVGIIVLLLSLGYGIEKLIISKVAGLDELKIIDVSIGDNTAVRLNKSFIDKIVKLPAVQKVIPIISVVGKVTYNKANTDVLVYGVSKDYLDLSKVKLIKGELFADNSEFTKSSIGIVAGTQTKIEEGEYNKEISPLTLQINILPLTDATVWSECSIYSKLLGYTKRVEGGYNGHEYWGSEYYPFSSYGRVAYDSLRKQYLGKWVKINVPIYQKNHEEILLPQLNNSGNQVWIDGCIEKKYIQVSDSYQFGSVLGETTYVDENVLAASDSAVIDTFSNAVVSTNSAGIEFVELQASESAKKKTNTTLSFEQPPSGKAVISTGLLNLLSLSMQKAIGTKFDIQFIIVKSLKPDIEGRAFTNTTQYEIQGIVEDAETAFMYVPISDVQKTGISNFSQVKVSLKNQGSMGKIRKEIETLGLRTTSTADTVAQIESLFANLRLILALLGLVALGVASLGMFNTLTVSLLERTREIGGMKTMGMISSEVQDLFLAEAMIMGLSGGFGGLFMGYIIGKAMSFAISIIAISQGQGYLELTNIPGFLSFFIIISSFIVGVLTGLYPAQRAKKISALNALRYE